MSYIRVCFSIRILLREKPFNRRYFKNEKSLNAYGVSFFSNKRVSQWEMSLNLNFDWHQAQHCRHKTMFRMQILFGLLSSKLTTCFCFVIYRKLCTKSFTPLIHYLSQWGNYELIRHHLFMETDLHRILFSLMKILLSYLFLLLFIFLSGGKLCCAL